MADRLRIVAVQPPSPPGFDVIRDWQGGYGNARKTDRADFGQSEVLGHFPYTPLLAAATVLDAKGMEVTYVDAQALRLGLRETVDRVSSVSPDVVICAANLPSLGGDCRVMAEVKRALARVPLVALGTVCRSELFHKPLLETADALIVGDAEVVVCALVEALGTGSDLACVPGIALRSGSEVLVTRPAAELRDLDSLPFPAYHLLEMDRYETATFGRPAPFMAVYSSRGCPFPCAYYCPYPFGFGRHVLLRDPGSVGEEVDLLVRQWKRRVVLFRDQTFTLNPNHARAVCEQMLQRELSFRWVCETRFDRVDRDLLKLMYRAGCRQVHFGLESGAASLHCSVGKPGGSLEAACEAVAACKELGLRALVHVIVGLPGENWATIKQTSDFLRRLRPDSLHVGVITPYPGTALYEEAKQKGLLLNKDWSHYSTNEPVMRTEYLSSEDLLRARSYVRKALGPPFVRRALRGIASRTQGLARFALAGANRGAAPLDPGSSAAQGGGGAK